MMAIMGSWSCSNVSQGISSGISIAQCLHHSGAMCARCCPWFLVCGGTCSVQILFQVNHSSTVLMMHANTILLVLCSDISLSFTTKMWTWPSGLAFFPRWLRWMIWISRWCIVWKSCWKPLMIGCWRAGSFNELKIIPITSLVFW